MKLDRFDIVTLVAVLTLAASAALMGAQGPEAGQAVASPAMRAKAAPLPPEYYVGLQDAETLAASGQVSEAAAHLKALSDKHPQASGPHALLGQLHARGLDYPSAMREYKVALMMEPDYADKRSEKFIGKRIKSAVKEAMSEAKGRLSKDPSDTAARACLKDAYYIERMLAGGCE